MSGRRGFLKRVLGLGAGAAVIAADPTVALAKRIGPGDGVAASEKALREQIRTEVEQQMLTRLQTELAQAQKGWMSSIDVRKLEENPIQQMMPDPLGPYDSVPLFSSATLGMVPWWPTASTSGYQMKQMLQIPRYAPFAMPTDERITARYEMPDIKRVLPDLRPPGWTDEQVEALKDRLQAEAHVDDDRPRITLQNGSVIEAEPKQTECCWGFRCPRAPVWYVWYDYDDDTYACDKHKADALAYARPHHATQVYRYSVANGIDYSSVEN